MTIMGKILVVLNLLFALVVGAFLVIDFGIRTNWKKEFDKVRDELQVARANVTTMHGTSGELSNTAKNLQNMATADKAKFQRDLADKDAELTANKFLLAEERERVTQANLLNQKYLGEAERLRKENELLNSTINERNKLVAGLEERERKAKQESSMFRQQADATQSRNEFLLDENRKLSQALALKEAGVGVTAGAKDRDAPNPPPVRVKGVIQKIDSKDPSLVQVNVGSDHGVNKNHTLEVYRFDPPQYLGMIRIVDAAPHNAIGRLMRSTARGALREGDQVASSLATRQ